MSEALIFGKVHQKRLESPKSPDQPQNSPTKIPITLKLAPPPSQKKKKKKNGPDPEKDAFGVLAQEAAEASENFTRGLKVSGVR